jgi:hypothetical protein
VLVGAVALALVVGEWQLRRNRAWLAIAGLGAAALVAAVAIALDGSPSLVVARPGGAAAVATEPGAGLGALALGGAAVAAGGLLLGGGANRPFPSAGEG